MVAPVASCVWHAADSHAIEQKRTQALQEQLQDAQRAADVRDQRVADADKSVADMRVQV